ncbi:GAF and ANTAR domain-containing protein [Nakamurella flavida]|uniref:GAF and ANTAR domain-containing protein n=1 Tax=Nakamurella flavida TaxID=363630 RepID=A0A938YKK6_9ACTN|nr:GAF and ANTAR domain-containing protein [Nakamurella flavida]MBM9475152.1 GAF and ANTAR domain-containing protein [Nakamurella flavida]MDP9776721.1 GAF domain-containing protein [Nakamurella flavida]
MSESASGGSAQDRDADEDLATSLAGLAGLTSLGSTLESVLTQIATFAVQAIPGAEGAGLTLLEEGRSDTIVKTASFVVQVDDIQYSLGEGPCIDAAAQRQTMRSGSLGGDPRWPRFGPRVGRLGVHSVLSLPLITPAGVVGAMNVYAHGKDSFDEQSERIGEVFAAPAAVSVQNAQILAQTQRLAGHLQAALTNRAVIDQAIGILRSRGGLTSDEAFDRLRHISQHENRKLSAVAASLVEEAVNRTRLPARLKTPPPPS